MPNSKKTVAAVAFDMDGLMFNTEDIYDIVGNELLQSRGHQFTRELKLKMMGLPGEKAMAVMKSHCNLDDEIQVLMDESNQHYQQVMPSQLQMMPGLSTLLEQIEELKIPKAIATSSHRRHAEFALGQFGLLERFEFLLTSADVTSGKPAPDIYLLAAERLEVSVSELLVLEDSLHGTMAAATAGAITVAIPGTHGAGQDYSHSDYVVDRLDSEVILMLLNRQSALPES